MKKIVIWIKKWSFFIYVILFGIVYLTMSNNWQVYAEPLRRAEKLWQQIEMTDSEAIGLTEAGAKGRNKKSEVPSVDREKGEQEDEQESTQGTVSDGDLAEEIPAEVTPEEVTYRNPEDVVFCSVEDDYFADAVFIGDSRTVGLGEYAGLEDTAAFYASTGLTVYKMFNTPIVDVGGQKQKETVEQALTENTFSKIYLMIGINEMGMGTVDSFMETYEQAVEHLQELQPDAVIYLQGIIKVTKERSDKGDYINNEAIDERNARIAELADNVKVYYLDVNPLICDGAGGLEASYTFDGVHLKAQYISIWKDYLKEHAVEETVK